MCGCGSTTVTEASLARSLFCNPRAVYKPTYPPPRMRIRVGSDLTAMTPWWHCQTGDVSYPSFAVTSVATPPKTIQLTRFRDDPPNKPSSPPLSPHRPVSSLGFHPRIPPRTPLSAETFGIRHCTLRTRPMGRRSPGAARPASLAARPLDARSRFPMQADTTPTRESRSTLRFQSSPDSDAASDSTARNISGVNLPVNVFCCDTWYEPSTCSGVGPSSV